MIQSQGKKKQLRDTNSDMIELLELTDTDFKIAIINIFKDLKGKTEHSKQIGKFSR